MYPYQQTAYIDGMDIFFKYILLQYIPICVICSSALNVLFLSVTASLRWGGGGLGGVDWVESTTGYTFTPTYFNVSSEIHIDTQSLM